MKINKREVLLVAGGAVASCVLGKVLKSKGTRNLAVKTIAKGLETKDNFEYTIAKMKEEAEDIYVSAVMENALEDYDFEDDFLDEEVAE
ncbi:MAG: hypothetical protein ACK5LY_04455 [Lachnospirales bacterium]